MISSLPAQHFLDVEGESAYVALHQPLSEHRGAAGVLLCPPFGWDEVCAYRPLRAWGDRLAQSGIVTARLSYPSTGDSSGQPGDARRLDAWTAAVDAAVRWLRANGPCEHVTVVGLQLGGLVAFRAAATAAPGTGPDALVLWAAPARGQRLLRQLRAFSQMEEASFYDGLAEPPAADPDGIEAGGFWLSAATVRDLNTLDLPRLPFSGGAPPRTLLLGRDGLPVDARLREALEAAGSEVTVADGPGYADMVSHVQTARPSWPVLETIATWLTVGPRRPTGGVANGGPPVVPRSAPALISADGEERPLTIDHDHMELSAILSRPAGESHDLGLLMLNAGAIRRVGPNRMWTEAARRWARRGVPSLRLDLESIGESSGRDNVYAEAGDLYAPALEAQLTAAVDRFSAETGCRQFMVIGMCSGAYWAVHLAASDPRVTSAFSVNPRALVWNESLIPARNFRAFWMRPVSIGRLRRALRSERLPVVLKWLARSALQQVMSRLRPAAAGSRVAGASTGAVLDALSRSGARAYFAFAADEPLLDELRRAGHLDRIAAWDTIRIEHLAVRDHLIRPIWAQARLHALLDAAVQAELARGGVTQPRDSHARNPVGSPL